MNECAQIVRARDTFAPSSYRSNRHIRPLSA